MEPARSLVDSDSEIASSNTKKPYLVEVLSKVITAKMHQKDSMESMQSLHPNHLMCEGTYQKDQQHKRSQSHKEVVQYLNYVVVFNDDELGSLGDHRKGNSDGILDYYGIIEE